MKAPLTPPVSGAAQQQFMQLRNDFSAPESGGRISGMQSGFPLWKLVWTLGNIGPDRTDAWQAFLDALRGATRRFLAWDLRRPYPKAYASVGFAGMTRAGGGSFDGTATSWSENITVDGDSQVTLHGLPVGFVMAPGDYIGFSYAVTEDSDFNGLTWHCPVRVTVGGVANGLGGLLVTSEPPIPLGVPSGAIAYLDHPKAVFTLVTDQSNLQGVDRSLGARGGQIVGVQDIRSGL